MKVVFNATFSVSLSATEWALFSDQPGVEEVANKLSAGASIALGLAWGCMTGKDSLSGFDAEQLAVREWQKVAATIDGNFGAGDSEPRNIMRELASRLLRTVPEDTVEFLRASR
ncbi:hypothetical protein POK33_39725 [Burkholderia cenocepacia]|uniref:hypothetical protein n=1 Tax=Burkholderia cenocepacia TaxID=95486 RepID=UPI0023B8B4F3|nr:hypothetical protein [Burkholderia cenocepacia]MDF0506884.1 hypothetical protein [Burkholderia cenocepacia]